MLQVLPAPAVVTVGESQDREATAAVREAATSIDRDQTCFVLAFVPSTLSLDPLAEALNRELAGIPVFGCTTAGQITPAGYETEALLLIAFPKAHFRCATQLLSPLKPLSIQTIAAGASQLAARFQRTADWNRLALTFTDGLSKQEDVLVAALEMGLGELPVFGGSAGDGLDFKVTHVLHAGRFHENAAVLILLETDLEFSGLGFDHFLPTEQWMVVTRAVPEERLVIEINGAPAAEEYARLVGVDLQDLSPRVFAENPVLVRNNSLYHVRAIKGVEEGGALSFFSAIDDGLLLRLGHEQEILRTLESGLDVRDARGAAPDFVLGFDCFLRKLEIEQKQMTRAASDILRTRRVLGFNTYGEQHCGVHVNQTFVGVAFFGPKRRDLH
jgi:hypothetical protein